MRHRPALLAAALLAAGCAPAGSASPAPDHEYRVYTVVLDRVFAEAPRTAYLVRPTTHGQAMFGASEMLSQALERTAVAPPSLVQSFRQRNLAGVAIDPARFRTRKPVQLAGDGPVERAIQERSGEDPVPPAAPASGIITLSRVGFSGDGSRAAVHAFFLCGVRCGGGTLVVLERVGNTWVVLADRPTVQY